MRCVALSERIADVTVLDTRHHTAGGRGNDPCFCVTMTGIVVISGYVHGDLSAATDQLATASVHSR